MGKTNEQKFGEYEGQIAHKHDQMFSPISDKGKLETVIGYHFLLMRLENIK